VVVVPSGNLEQIVAIPRSGRGESRVLFSLTNAVFALDAGLDGSIYVDQLERPVELLRFSSQGGRSEKISTLLPYEAPGSSWFADQGFAVLPDGRAVLAQATNGRMRLVAVETGKYPVSIERLRKRIPRPSLPPARARLLS
jgi:hypothetical protein